MGYIKVKDAIQAICDWITKGEMKETLAETTYAGDQSFLAGAMWGAAMASIQVNTKAERIAVVDAHKLIEAVMQSMVENPHEEGRVRVNHRNEHLHFLNMIERMIE